MPPPIQHEAYTLSEEDDSLSKAPQRVSSNEEPPIEMTSWSIIYCSIKSLESLSPMSMVELDNNEDIIRENEYLEETNEEETGNRKQESKEILRKNNDPKSNVHSI